MRYADSLLADGEVVVLRARQHWLALVIEGRAGVALMAVAVVLLAVVALDPFNNPAAEQIISTIALVCLAIGLAWFLFQAWQWLNQDYLVTNRRILKVEGIINKRSADSSLEKINDAMLRQDLFGRLFNYGDLDILTAADAAIDRYHMLEGAPGFKREMLNQKHNLELEVSNRPPSPPIRFASRSGGSAGSADGTEVPEAVTPPARSRPTPVPPGAPGPVPPTPRQMTADEVTRTLGQLADLRDRGAISAEEYDAKKRELLARL